MVATNGHTSNFSISSAFSSDIAMHTPNTASMHTSSGEFWRASAQNTMPAKLSVVPTDISRPPDMITNAWPIASRPQLAISDDASVSRFSVRRNTGFSSVATMATTSTGMMLVTSGISMNFSSFPEDAFFFSAIAFHPPFLKRSTGS